MTAKTAQLRLNQSQRFKLYKWIDANHQDFNGKSDKEVAALAFEAMGFPVADTTINDIRTDPKIEANWKASRNKTVMRDSANDARVIASAVVTMHKALTAQGIQAGALSDELLSVAGES